MEVVALVLVVSLWGLVVGALARFALPGPDPLSLLWTVALGVAGSLLGGVLGRFFFGTSGGLLLAVIGATVLLAAYRRLVQKRGLSRSDGARPSR